MVFSHIQTKPWPKKLSKMKPSNHWWPNFLLLHSILWLLLGLGCEVDVLSQNDSSGGGWEEIIPIWIGCFTRPWICGGFPLYPTSIMCCWDVCINVTSDVNKCGFCGRRSQIGFSHVTGFCVPPNNGPPPLLPPPSHNRHPTNQPQRGCNLNPKMCKNSRWC